LPSPRSSENSSGTSGTRPGLTRRHPPSQLLAGAEIRHIRRFVYDDATYATAHADLHRLGDNLGRRAEIIRAAAAVNIDRTEITEVTGLPPITVDRALAPLDPEAFHTAMAADRDQDWLLPSRVRVDQKADLGG